MNELTKKRTSAIVIDVMIANGVVLVVEPILKKKIKSEFFHAMVTQSVVLWALEYTQVKLTRQTAGQRIAGIKIESENGEELTSKQIIKRVLHRDFPSLLQYWRNREEYDAYQGKKFPHDVYAGTVMKEV